MSEDIKKPVQYITTDEALQLFQSILQNYSGIFRIQSGKLQSIRINLVNLSADPTIGEVGDLVVVGGKLKICTATTPTWVIVGTQA